MESRETSPVSAASRFRMIDVGAKAITRRRALARGRIVMARDTLEKIRQGTIPKGDPLALGEAAGILAAKQTSAILPLCHPLPLDAVNVRFRLVELSSTQGAVDAECEVTCEARTGVEMEALFGVQAALLCVYDLAKAVDPVLSIETVRLAWKEGGKHGVWRHPADASASLPPSPVSEPAPTQSLSGLRASVLTVSDRVSRNEAEDRTGPKIHAWLQNRGAQTAAIEVVPDEPELIRHALMRAIEGADRELVILTGGTGFGPRDVTPEAVLPLLGRQWPGFGEALRALGARHKPQAYLSRAFAGMRGKCWIVALPGSPSAVRDGLTVLDELLPHGLEIARALPNAHEGESHVR
ncbi:MAG: bifunctional molybdenum cofactor biosynthesis protein MoaC/MoaB [Bacteriovoracia bacterium]